jgi:hypothetical protein
MTSSNTNTCSISDDRLSITRSNLPVLLFYLALIHLCAISVTAENRTGRIDKLIQRKLVLTRKLDSLDLLKQQMKRKGVPINEVEHREKMLHDSIASFKSSIQSLSKHTPAARPPSETILFLPKPTNLFDWIIVIVGFIATFSGIMLLAGILRSIKTRRKKARRQRLQQQYQNSNSSIPPVSAYPQPTEPAYPEQPEPNTPEVQTSINRQYTPLPDTGTIALLKKRVKQHTPPEPEQPPPRPVIEKPVLPSESIQSSFNRDADSLEQAIIEAAEDGLDHAAISKKFHVSIDHISLILKVADKRQ